MSQHALALGERVRMNGKLYILREQIGSKWVLEQSAGGESVVIDEAELLKLYIENLLAFVAEAQINERQTDDSGKNSRIFADYPEDLKNIAIIRLRYVEAAKRYGNAQEAITYMTKVQVTSELPSPATVANWVRRYEKSGKDVCSLIPDYAGRGNAKPRYSEMVAEVATI